MTEAEAKAWIDARWGAAAIDKLARYAELLRAENERQNLVARSTLEMVWTRHLLDSAQLVPFAKDDGIWVDIGSGAGLPGIVAAILWPGEVIAIEPRRRRVDFLNAVINELSLNARTVQLRADQFRNDAAAVISARAVASLSELFIQAQQFTDSSTIWLLPKGRSAQSELEAAEHMWQGVFHVEQSLTAPDSQIVIARKVKRR